MSKRIHILGSACIIIGALIGVLGWLLRFARLMLVPKAVLAAKLVAAKSQLAACVDAVDRKKAPKPRFKLSFRLLWIVLSRLLPEWRKLTHVMQPDGASWRGTRSLAVLAHRAQVGRCRMAAGWGVHKLLGRYSVRRDAPCIGSPRVVECQREVPPQDRRSM